MYSEALVTPHPNKNALNSALLQDALHELPAFREEDEPIETAIQIAQLVYSSLWFRSHTQEHAERSTSTLIDQEQYTNCLGYAVVFSECLEKASIEHKVAYVNGHGAVVVNNDNEHWFIDAQAPIFTGSLASAVVKKQLLSIDDQIAKYGRAAVKMKSDLFVSSLGLSCNFSEMAQKYPWLTLENMPTDEYDRFASPRKLRQKRTLLLNLFDPAAGRETLAAYDAFNFYLREDNLAEAYQHFISMNAYPDVDVRSKLIPAKRIIHKLGRVGLLSDARSILDKVCEDTSISEDPRITEWKGDQLRALGRLASDPSMLEEAVETYDEAASRAQFSSTIESKCEKTKLLIASCV